MPSLTRGPLSSSVYWRRRLVLLTVAVILVVAIAKLLGHGSDASSPAAGPDAQGVAAVTSDDSTPTPSLSSTSPAAPRTRHSMAPIVPTSSTPAEPTGTCQPSDVLVSPHADDAVLGEPVTITLDVSTISEPACYWHLSPSAAQVRISHGGSTVWSTVDCGVAVPRQQLVVRQGEPTSVTMSWAGHRTDQTCSSHDPWVKTPGRYWVSAAALGGSPSSSSFLLTKTATETGSPTTTATPGATGTPGSTATPGTTATPGSTGTAGSTATHSSSAPPAGGAKRTLPPNNAD